MATTQRSRLALAVAVMTLLQLVAVAPARAATLSAGNVQWSVSKAHPGDTGARYTWSFEAATTATLSKITFTVPEGTTAPGGVSVADAYGVTAGGTAGIEVSGSPEVVTYTFTPVSVAAGVKVLIALDGLTNTTTVGDYTSTLTTYDNAMTPAAVDTGTSNTVTFADNTTDVTVVVARTTVFTNDTTGFELLMDPGNAAYADQSKAITLTVKTNAGGGYGLDVKAGSLQNSGATRSIAPITADLSTGVASGSFTVNRWGYAIAAVSGTDAVGVRQGALITDGNYVGYRSSNDRAVVAAGPTNGDTITLTNRVKLDYKQPADTYTSTITYTVTPTY